MKPRNPLEDGYSVFALEDMLQIRLALRPRNRDEEEERKRVVSLVLSDPKRFGYYGTLLAIAVRELMAARDRARLACEQSQPLDVLRDLLK